MIRAGLNKDYNTSFKCLQYNKRELRETLGETLAQGCIDVLSQHSKDQIIKKLEYEGFNVSVKPVSDGHRNGYNLLDYHGPKPSDKGILIDVKKTNGESIIPEHQIVTFKPESLSDKWTVIMDKVGKHITEFNIYNKAVKPVERGLTSTTYFEDLGYYAEKEFPKIAEREFKQAQLDKLGDRIYAKRNDKYWEITISKGDHVPVHVAEMINKYYHDTIRIDGMPNGISPQRFKESHHNVFGVRSWHVDTIEGLAELSASLRDYYEIDTPRISADQMYQYLADLANRIKNREHDKNLH